MTVDTNAQMAAEVREDDLPEIDEVPMESSVEEAAGHNATEEAAAALDENSNSGDIFSSIAKLRKVLMVNDLPRRDVNDSSTVNMDSHPSFSALQELRYKEKRELQQQVQEREEALDKIQKELDLAKDELDRERSLRRTSQDAHKALHQHQLDLNVQLEIVTKSRESMEEKLLSAENRLGGIQSLHDNHLAGIEKDLADATSEIEEKTKIIGQLEVQCAKAEQERDEIKKKTGREREELQTHVQELQEAQASANKRLQELESALSDSEAKVNRCEDNIVSLEAAAEEAEEMTASIKLQAGAAKEKAASLEAKLEEATSKISDLEAELQAKESTSAREPEKEVAEERKMLPQGEDDDTTVDEHPEGKSPEQAPNDDQSKIRIAELEAQLEELASKYEEMKNTVNSNASAQPKEEAVDVPDEGDDNEKDRFIEELKEVIESMDQKEAQQKQVIDNTLGAYKALKENFESTDRKRVRAREQYKSTKEALDMCQARVEELESMTGGLAPPQHMSDGRHGEDEVIDIDDSDDEEDDQPNHKRQRT